jgi:hypothetical protein
MTERRFVLGSRESIDAEITIIEEDSYGSKD